MTEEHADRYVSNALAFHEGWDAFEVVASVSSLPAVTQAFARRGWTVTTQARTGFLHVEKTADSAWPGGDGPEML